MVVEQHEAAINARSDQPRRLGVERPEVRQVTGHQRRDGQIVGASIERARCDVGRHQSVVDASALRAGQHLGSAVDAVEVTHPLTAEPGTGPAGAAAKLRLHAR